VTAPADDTSGPVAGTAVEIATDVIGRHQYTYNTRACGCGWSGHAVDHPRHVADRLATVGVLTAGGAT
jgi:hypothetical protein